jgi:hypothetical protein
MREIRTEIEIDASAERVWDVLTDVAAYDEWNPFIKLLEGELREGSRLRATIAPPGGRATTFTPSVIDLQPRRRVVWLGHLGVRWVFDGEHIHEIEELGRGRTRYVQRERFTGALVPFVGGMLRKTEEGFRRMNAELKERAERSPSRP